jgi:hypothetical protein
MTQVSLTLTSMGAEPVQAVGGLRLLSPGARAARAALILLIAAGLAAAIIPVPIVHLIGIPLILGLGLVGAIRQLRSVALLSPVRMPCPRCGALNSFGGGLGLRSATDPIVLNCESCRRPLELRITASDLSDSR